MVRGPGEMWDEKAAGRPEGTVLGFVLEAHQLLQGLGVIAQRFPVLSPLRALRIHFVNL